MAEETTASGRVSTPPPPPRISGEPEKDLVALNQWAWDFYNAQRLSNNAISGVDFASDDFDPSTLPDPAATNLAQAQQTANEAYTLANEANETAEPLQSWELGQLTIDGTNTVGTFTFSSEQADTSYFVFLQPIGTTGSPTTDSLIVIDVTKATDDIEVTIQTAPGSGNSVIFDVLIARLT